MIVYNYVSFVSNAEGVILCVAIEFWFLREKMTG